jgi:hypothetical protein
MLDFRTSASTIALAVALTFLPGKASAHQGHYPYHQWSGYYWTQAQPAVRKVRRKRHHVRHRRRHHAARHDSSHEHTGAHHGHRADRRVGRPNHEAKANEKAPKPAPKPQGRPRTAAKVAQSPAAPKAQKPPAAISGAAGGFSSRKEVVPSGPQQIKSTGKPNVDRPWPDAQLARAINSTKDETAIYAPPAILGFIESHVANIFHSFFTFLVHRPEAPIDRLPKVLQAKLMEIQNACHGYKTISTVCGPHAHSFLVRGSGRPSLHCTDQAADFVVSKWSCASPFLTLAKWRGGANRDPEIVNHFHISLGGREDGIRFCHRGKRKDGSCSGGGTQIAHHHHVRVAHLSPYRHARRGG